MTVLWRQYKQFSGCLVRGTAPIVVQDPTKHLSCAAWLTSEAEAPSYGFVQSYDGAGISAGLLHNILVAPRDLSQGDLGQLLRRIMDVAAHSSAQSVFAPAATRWLAQDIASKGWALAPDGKFRTTDGKLVGGAALRDWVAPPLGNVPKSGEFWDRASMMASAFHDIFAWQTSWKIQEDFAIEWLARGNKPEELAVYQTFGNHADLDSFVSLDRSAIPADVHVAMCVYHSFSVNSPAVAADCLARAKTGQTRATFAKALIREFGLHGRDVWHDEPGDGNNRYDRTRVALWSREDLFPGAQDLMPRDLA